jgi:hypothetical protein
VFVVFKSLLHVIVNFLEKLEFDEGEVPPLLEGCEPMEF